MPPSEMIRCSVVTPEAKVLDTDAVSVVVPAHDGELGILLNRAPLMCQLGAGALRVTPPGEQTKVFYIDGGFAQVIDNKVSVLTEKAIECEKLSRKDAQQELTQALAVTARDEPSMEDKHLAAERARAKARLAKH